MELIQIKGKTDKTRTNRNMIVPQQGYEDGDDDGDGGGGDDALADFEKFLFDKPRRKSKVSFEPSRPECQHEVHFAVGSERSGDQNLQPSLVAAEENNVFHYTAIISSCGESFKWDCALNFLKEMADSQALCIKSIPNISQHENCR